MQFRPGEIEGVEIRPLERYSDERGWLAELFRADEVNPELAPAMGYVSITKPGVSRGPHEHREQTDWFCFVGPGAFEVRMWDNRPNSLTHTNSLIVVVGVDNPSVIIIPPGVVHAYTNVGDSDAMSLNFPNRLYAGEGRRAAVDEIRHEADLGSPFSVE